MAQMRSLKRISTVFGLLAATAAPTLAQSTTPNQATADRVAGALGATALQSGSRVAIETRDGLVTLSGTVNHPAVKAELLAQAQRVSGVTAVADHLRVVGDAGVRPVQFESMPSQIALGGHHRRGAVYGGHGAIDGPIVTDGAAVGGYDGGPIPEGAAYGGGTQAAIPNQPNYAWPSYAPYPNYSAVGYPTVYPWQAWPNIGPFHPYPEVPLDWRAVTLRWDDGLWWIDFKKHYTRPFFTPYPFGIFGY